VIFTFFVFYALVASWVGACIPVCDGFKNSLKIRSFFPWSMIAISMGLGLGLLSFSLLGRLIPNSTVAWLASILGLLAFGHVGFGNFLNSYRQFFNRENLILIGLLLALHGALLYVRAHFPDIEILSPNFGGEKLYNFQYQQSFLHGNGFPPEHLWMSGNRINYYILPKALPGLASHFVYTLSGNARSGAVLFHLSDTFFVALASLLISNFAIAYRAIVKATDTVMTKKVIVFSLVLGLLPLAAFPLRALTQVFGGAIEIWSLSRIIPWTINEYPFWNFLWADNHAHSNVLFLQLTFWMCFISVLFLATQKTILQSIVLALLFAALFYSNQHSVLVNALVFAPVCVFLVANKRIDVAKTLVEFAFLSFVFALPALVIEKPVTESYFVTSKFSSTLSDFANVQFVLLSVFFLFLICVSTVLKIDFWTRLKTPDTFTKLNAAAAVLALIGGYPVVSLSLGVGILAHSIFASRNKQSNPDWVSTTLLYGALLLYILPEFYAFNLDYGEQKMRLNTVFKFYFESYYLMPIAGFSLFFPEVSALIAHKRMQTFAIAIGVFAVIATYVQYQTASARIAKSNDEFGLDGAKYLEKEFPADNEIISYLANMDGQVTIAEECGLPPKLSGYLPAGRIAAFSARPGLCGWGHHVTLYQKSVHNAGYEGDNNVIHVSHRDRSKDIFFWDQLKLHPEFAAEAKENLKRLGATHFVFGNIEKLVHPEANLDDLAKKLGKVVVRKGDLGLIEIE
jgi:uncharacterized membrane protein